MNVRIVGWLRYAGIAVGVLVLLLSAAAAWIVNTEPGARWLLARIGALTEQRFAVAAVQGTLSGPLTLDGLRVETAAMRLNAERVHIEAALGALLRRTVHLKNVELRGVDVLLQARTDRQEEPAGAFDLRPPVDLIIDRFMLNDGRLRRAEEILLTLRRTELIGRWTDSGIELEQFDVYASQGEIHLNGRAAKSGVYSGEAAGRFQWTADLRTYAGELRADTQGERALLNLELKQPLAASLQFSLEQRNELPWQFTLRVPRFDPREQGASSSLRSLAAAVSGSGTRSAARLSGNIAINDQPLELRTLQLRRRDSVIVLQAVDVRIADSPGALRASGELTFGDTARAALDVNWTELRIPESWAGQRLQTRGRMRIDGSVERYRAEGRLALGPPGRLADITLEVNGSPQAVNIETLRIEQPRGRLRASGRVQLDPGIRWRLMAEATRFNPGELLSGWQGDLNFALTTDGSYAEDNLRAALNLERLAGTLRGRTLSGGGSLRMNAQHVLGGDLRLRADASTVEFHGDSGGHWNAALTLGIASLNDWLPQAGGSVQGRFTITGDWPRINVAGNARGRDLRLATLAADELAFSADVRVPERPAGVVRADVSGVAAAGFNFSKVETRLSGDEQAHELDFNAMGKPLAFEIAASGRRVEGGWAGSVRQLALQVADVQRLTLQQAMQVEYSAEGFRVSQSCLAGGDTRLCVAGSGATGGELQLSYELQNVPLSLANAAAPTLPVAFEGRVEGRGAIHRDASGRWLGNASVLSPSGSIAQTGAVQTSPLLSYANFKLDATLDGSQGVATVNAQIDETGKLAGRGTLNGLGTETTTLQGAIEAGIPSLAALSLVTPQLANVTGRAQLQAMLSGTLDAPQITGTLQASELGAQLPLLGLQLRSGNVRAVTQAGGDVRLSGNINSGEGRLQFDGTWASRGAQLRLGGDRALLADIPSARVVATPDLSVRWAEQQLTVEGEVRVPTASVDVQKLPRGAKPPRISDDVIVVDQEIAAKETASLPIVARVTVILGDEVKVTGYGLDSTVKGPLTVREQPGQTTRASGDLTVAGTYKAYGQDLTIQKGRVLYADAPLDNPQLDISAVRMVDEVTAGLRIAGTARQPQISVFSDPVMGEANALSYLVAGRPLDEIGTGEEEGSALQSAARSLGTAGGGLLAKQLGKRLGVDEVSVKEDELIGGAAFTVGEYLSPRLFLSYGVGLFEPGEVVTLRYRLSSTLSLQAQRGSEETRAGVQYRTER